MTIEQSTAPKPSAFVHLRWQMDVTLTWTMAAKDPNVDTAFPLVIDQILAKFLTTVTAGYRMIDPVTGNNTQLLAIGERGQLAYTRLKTTGTQGQGLVVFGADMTIEALEGANFLPGTFYGPPNPGVDP